MKHNILLLLVVILLTYFGFVFCNENLQKDTHLSAITEGSEEGRLRRRHHHLWKVWGWHALAIAFWIKIKVIIVSFFVGSAIFLGLRYYWPLKSCHSSPPIYFSSPPSSYHDHIPYSLDSSVHSDHVYESDPYSHYTTSYGSDAIVIDDTHSIQKRGGQSTKNKQKRAVPSGNTPMRFEDRIGEITFMFLGVDSPACRRRFICELEFNSLRNPVTSMAFRIVGRGFFERYMNARSEHPATSFQECAVVNSDCVFIEENETEEADENVQVTTMENLSNEIVENNASEEQTTTEKPQLRKHKYRKYWK